jgi:hypothetical protein
MFLIWCAEPAAVELPVSRRLLHHRHRSCSSSDHHRAAGAGAAQLELTPYGIKHLTELQQLTKLRLDAVGLKRGIECFIMPNSTMVSCAALTQAKLVRV